MFTPIIYNTILGGNPSNTVIDDLADVVITSPTSTDVLAYDVLTKKWINSPTVSGDGGSFIIGADEDTNNTNVVCVLNFENNYTNVVDSTNFTVEGSVTLNTDIKKFDNYSIKFPGNGGNIQKSSPTFAFGTGDFTVELWTYPISFPGYATLMGTRSSSSSEDTKWSITINSSGTVILYSVSFYYFGTLTLNTWNHVVIQRKSGIMTGYINGVKSTDTTDSRNYTFELLSLGAHPGGSEPYGGYIDSVRITKGQARYTDSFTVPTEPYTYTPIVYPTGVPNGTFFYYGGILYILVSSTTNTWKKVLIS